MHFVTGGAFNGKRKWVKKNYPAAQWISAYDGNALLDDLSTLEDSMVVLEGIESWIKNSPYSREGWRELFKSYLDWEESYSKRKVIVIGTDISKGIVPMEEENRTWRDKTGWVYQDLVVVCDSVDVIWYGINQTIKG